MDVINKIRAEVEKKTHGEQGYSSGDAECGYRDCARDILAFLDTLEAKKIPNWKKTMHDNGCWSCEIGVDPSKRLYEYGRYTIDADELFKLLDKEE